MRARRGVALALVLASSLVGCSGGGSGSDARLALVGFNLDGVNGVFLNERLIFDFNTPVDPDSVDVNTIQIRFDASRIDVDGDCFPDESANSAAIVEGTFLVEGSRVIFQPRIPAESDQDIGIFPSHDVASEPNPTNCVRDTLLTLTYLVTIPGVSPDTPTTVVSKNDKKPMTETYESSFTSTFDPTFPLAMDPSSFTDIVRGAPVFETLISPAPGAVDVSRDQIVTVRFSDAFLPSTVNPDTLFLAAVGPSTGRKQRVPLTYEIDPSRREITLIPTVGLPAGAQITVEYTSGMTDFGGNGLLVDEEEVFPAFTTVQAPQSGPFVYREDFDDDVFADLDETSADWNSPTMPGWLVAGPAGGIATHGELRLDPPLPETFVIDTGFYDPSNPLPSFDYTDCFVGRNATVRVLGENPLIIKSARDIRIEGVIDVSGMSADPITSSQRQATAGGLGIAGGGDGGAGGGTQGEAGGDGSGARIPGTPDQRTPGGGGGSRAPRCQEGAEAGGGGGGEYNGGAADGDGDGGNPNGGGAAGENYGASGLNPFAGDFLAGSGGGGAGATCNGQTIFDGTGGGGGGGAMWLHARGEIDIRGQILARGGNGGDNTANGGSVGGATGGGGSGGAILLQGYTTVRNSIDATISAVRGFGGNPNEGGGGNSGRGGTGGRGRIRAEARTREDLGVLNISFSPAPSRSDYDRGGNSTVGTSDWFDTRAFFADFTAIRGGRSGGPADQDNGNAFPVPDDAVQYLYQGAPTDPRNPFRPDFDDLRPGPGEFTANIDEIDDSRFIRVKVVLRYPYPDIGILPRSSFFAFQYTYRGEAEF